MSAEPDLLIRKTHPILFDEFCMAKNQDIEFDTLSKGSTVKVQWKCSINNHPSWAASMGTRMAGHNCPYCAGRLPVSGVTDLASHRELNHLLREWDFERNSITPNDVTPMSSRRIYWTGEKCGHSWQQPVSARALGQGCPYCAGVKILVGFNDLGTTHPEIANLWHPDNTFSPNEVTPGSNKKAKLLFPCSHVWENKIVEFTRKSGKCPYCAGSLFLSGYNDLATTHPDLASEWHPTKNTLLPTEVMAGSGKKAWWLGQCGHEWEAQINSRKRGNGCSQCILNGSSKVEQAFLRSLIPVIPDAHTGKIVLPNFKNPVQIDIMGTYNQRKIVIEYDGYNWHYQQQDIQLDLKKTRELLREDYYVVRVRECAYARSLPHLKLKHDNLFQLTMKYTADHRYLLAAVDEIKTWLATKEC